MEESYIKSQIGAVEQYLDVQQYIDESYKDKALLKKIVMQNNDYWNNRKEIVISVFSLQL